MAPGRIAMMHRLAIYLGIVSLSLVVPRVVVADATIQVTYDTVDFVEIRNSDLNSISHAIVRVRGIPSGTSNPNTFSFDFGNNVDIAKRCEQLAIIAMSKPGKYQFSIGSDSLQGNGGIVGHGDCRLTLVTP